MALGRLLKDVKDTSEVAERVRAYEGFFTPDTDGAAGRIRNYRKFITEYYDLASGLYEYGWGRSFHFALRHSDETFAASLARHEHFLALTLGIGSAMRVADFGCGVGGPAREISRFTGAEIVGFDINQMELERARAYTREAGLSDRIEFRHSDFMAVDAPDESFDAVYAIETTCCAPSKAGVYAEACRLLKPGGHFAAYEYCLTPLFDVDDAVHRQARDDIILGGGLPDLETQPQAVAAMHEAGFELLDARDVALATYPSAPWYEPLAGSALSFARFRTSAIGRRLVHALVRTLESLRLVPAGSAHMNRLLNVAARGLVTAGRLGIFTPMYLLHGRKPDIPRPSE